MSTIRITQITLSPTPSGATVCSVWYALDSDPTTFILASNSVSVPVSGILAVPLDITVPDNAAVRLRARANCGGSFYEEDAVPPTTTTTTAPATTTTTTTAAPTTTTTTAGTTTTTTTSAPGSCVTYKITAGEEVGGASNYSYNDCEGVPVEDSLSSPQEFVYICAQSGSVVFDQPAELTLEEVGTGCHTNLFDRFQYTPEGTGGISGICSFDATIATRTQPAADDSTALGKRMQLTVRYTADGNSTPFQEVVYTFEIGETEANEHDGVNLNSGGGCTSINSLIISLVEIP